MNYKIGDKVRVVNYGHLLWKFNEGKMIFKDMNPEIIGKEGIISDAHLTQDKPTYAIHGIPEKIAWYDEDQLEMVNPNPNTL